MNSPSREPPSLCIFCLTLSTYDTSSFFRRASFSNKVPACASTLTLMSSLTRSESPCSNALSLRVALNVSFGSLSLASSVSASLLTSLNAEETTLSSAAFFAGANGSGVALGAGKGSPLAVSGPLAGVSSPRRMACSALSVSNSDLPARSALTAASFSPSSRSITSAYASFKGGSRSSSIFSKIVESGMSLDVDWRSFAICSLYTGEASPTACSSLTTL